MASAVIRVESDLPGFESRACAPAFPFPLLLSLVDCAGVGMEKPGIETRWKI